MKLNKNLLLVTAIIGIGLFVLPSTLSMFAGQHSWYDPASEIPCTKCHFIESSELGTGPHSSTYNSGTHKVYNSSANYNGTSGYVGGDTFWNYSSTDTENRCYGCHQVQVNFSAAGSISTSDTWADKNNTVHAAIAIECIDCHPWVVNELIDEDAAHGAFYSDLNESGTTILKKANQACLGCHTHVGVNISWTRNDYVSYNVDCNKTGYTVTWNGTDELGTNTSQFQDTSGYP